MTECCTGFGKKMCSCCQGNAGSHEPKRRERKRAFLKWASIQPSIHFSHHCFSCAQGHRGCWILSQLPLSKMRRGHIPVKSPAYRRATQRRTSVHAHTLCAQFRVASLCASLDFSTQEIEPATFWQQGVTTGSIKTIK